MSLGLEDQYFGPSDDAFRVSQSSPTTIQLTLTSSSPRKVARTAQCALYLLARWSEPPTKSKIKTPNRGCSEIVTANLPGREQLCWTMWFPASAHSEYEADDEGEAHPDLRSSAGRSRRVSSTTECCLNLFIGMPRDAIDSRYETDDENDGSDGESGVDDTEEAADDDENEVAQICTAERVQANKAQFYYFTSIDTIKHV